MRYLKNFESLNTNSYYREIDESEFYSTPDTKYCCNISEEALNIVRKYFDNLNFESRYHRNGSSYCEFMTTSDEYVQVFELEDEWFLFYYTPYGCYLCDQLEGLDRLLNDISEGSIE